MNQRQGTALRRMIQASIELPYPDAEVIVNAQPDGVQLTITGVELRGEATSAGSGGSVRFRMSDDGPLKRFLLTGYVD